MVVAPILAISALLITISTLSARTTAESLGAAVIDGVTQRVATEVREYLGDAVAVSDLYVRRLADRSLPASGLQAWEPLMLQDLVINQRVASICFANPAGDATWLLRNRGRLEVGRVDGPGGKRALEYQINADTGELLSAPLRDYTYDAQSRPWYQMGIARPCPTWTPVYFWFGDAGGDAQTGTGYTRVVRDAGNQVIGVLVIDVTLGAISDFLKAVPISEGGTVFLIDHDDLVVAASRGRVNSIEGQRLNIEKSDAPAGPAVAEAIRAGATGNAKLLARTISGSIAGEPARIHIAPLTPYPGIDWRIITVLPESAFLGEVHQQQRRALMIAGAAVLAALVLGLGVARRMSGPIVRIREHVKRVGAGDFESRLDLHAARELTELSRDLNTAASELKQSMELQASLKVAVEVQQSLLPAGDPTTPGLDIVGRTRYCDATGGDYYDFINISPTGGGQTLIVLGDVMGHGIPAALLMASARAALRGHAGDVPDLGILMTKVNRVLSEDARHRRFLTLVLAVIDPAAHTIRWASGGHDPIMVYNPDTGVFEDLSAGGLPLGLDSSEVFEQYEYRALGSGRVIVFGTDGIWETRNKDAQQFGKERLKDIIRRTHARPAKEIAATLDDELNRFRGAAPVEDDITYVIVRVDQNGSPPAPAITR